MNECQLEAVIQRQRHVIAHAQQVYFELWSKNIELRELVLALRERLLDAGLDSSLEAEAPESPEQLHLALFEPFYDSRPTESTR
jgi:hypothetical protein